MEKICEVPGCDRPVESGSNRRYCPGHRARLKRTGGFGAGQIKNVPPRGSSTEDVIRFNGWTVTDSGCWEYAGPRFSNGYGQVKVNGTPQLVHRFVYELWVGAIPEGHVVRHKCDNKPCMNPDHLTTGTTQDNVDDRTKRDRTAVGERHTNAKLKDADAIEIRAYLSTANNRIERGKMYYELAAKYHVSYSCIQQVWLGNTFKHLL